MKFVFSHTQTVRPGRRKVVVVSDGRLYAESRLPDAARYIGAARRARRDHAQIGGPLYLAKDAICMLVWIREGYPVYTAFNLIRTEVEGPLPMFTSALSRRPTM